MEVAGAQVLGPTGVDETFAGQLVFPGGVLAQVDAGSRTGPRTAMEITGTAGGQERYRLEIEEGRVVRL